jgi:hypothetical protein
MTNTASLKLGCYFLGEQLTLLEAMHMYGNWELSNKDLPEQFFSFSDAYLDSARRLCVLLKRSTKKASYQRGCVVLYLTFHASELFLKGAILAQSPNEKLNHDLQGYYKRYKKLYPQKEFQFEFPFKTEYFGFDPEVIEQLKKQELPQDQLHKYPTDKSGNKWEGVFSFEPLELLNSIEKLRDAFKAIGNKILANYQLHRTPQTARVRCAGTLGQKRSTP